MGVFAIHAPTHCDEQESRQIIFNFIGDLVELLEESCTDLNSLNSEFVFIDYKSWVADIMLTVDCGESDIYETSELDRAEKSQSCEWVSEAGSLMDLQSGVIGRLHSLCEVLKSQLIKSQLQVIDVQSQLVNAKCSTIEDVKFYALVSLDRKHRRRMELISIMGDDPFVIRNAKVV